MINNNGKIYYEFFNNLFPVGCCSSYLKLPLVTIDDSFWPKKISCYNHGPLKADIYLACGKSINTLTAPPDYPKVIILNYDSPGTVHIIIGNITGHIKKKIIYCYMFHDGIRCYKTSRVYYSMYYILSRVYYCHLNEIYK